MTDLTRNKNLNPPRRNRTCTRGRFDSCPTDRRHPTGSDSSWTERWRFVAMTAEVKDELSRLVINSVSSRRAEVASLLRFAGLNAP